LRCGFGLGDATNADVVRIEWSSGIVQEFANVAAKQFLTVKEPVMLAASPGLTNGMFQITLVGGKGHSYVVETSNDLSDWSSLQTVTNMTGTLQFATPCSTNGSSNFYRVQEQ